jgi:hypothetical protein
MAEATPSSEVAVSYPLRLSEPDFNAPGEPFKLVDLRYGFSDTFTTTHAFAARVRVGGWGYLGAELEGERRTMTFEAHRLFLAAEGAAGEYDLLGRYRAPWFIFSANAHRRPPAQGGNWLLIPGISVRLSRDFELLGEVTGDTGPQGGFPRAASAGFLWQRGVRFEMQGEYAHAREVTEEGSENVRNTGTLRFVAQRGPAELSGEALLDDVEGRFPRQQREGALSLRLTLTSRLLLEGGGRIRFEEHANERAHEYRGALTWFARRFYLPRSGPAAARTLLLARRATEMGENERRVFDDDERRAQRERLSLSRHRDEVRDDMIELYRSQVTERPVPTLGFAFAESYDALSGFASRTARVQVGVPWRPGWPWRHDESAVPFLRLDLEREARLSGRDYEAIRQGLALTVSFNREMDLVFRWSRTDPTPLDLIRGIGRRRTVAVAYVYAFGR